MILLEEKKQMGIIKLVKALSLITVVSILSACGVAHVKTDIQSKDLTGYENILIGEVNVYSEEPAAKNNVKLQKKLKDWEAYSLKQLNEYVSSSNYNLVTSLDGAEGDTLLMDLDINVQYGNRALRWVVGFGAGKGGVDSILTVKDAKTGEVKHKIHADSDLSIGSAGGDIGDVLEKNIRKLIEQYRRG